MDDKEIRAKAKSLGIKSSHNKKVERLEKEIAEKLDVNENMINTDEDKKGFLKRCGFNFNGLSVYAKELGGTKLVYRARIKAFECYKEEQSIEFLSVSMFQ